MSDAESHPGQCQKCGAPLAGNAVGGLCPRCLMALNLATETEVPGETGPHGTRVVPPPPAPEEISGLFPHLQILECLGRGGMGVVYKARQPKLNRLVALKLLAPEKGADTRFAERFTREAQALARLSHPNIVTVYDFGEEGGRYYLLMEFVDGLSLRQLLQSRKLGPEEALAIVPRICEALQYAHEQGIVHRDIKPENILLDKQGRLKIADFGIAKIVHPVTPSEGEGAGTGGESLTQDQVVGTPHYMAPEQVEHPLKVDHRADIYSLGVVFYEMLTGELPLGKFAPPSKKVQVDVRLDEVVLHTLEKEPERRYQRASQVKTDVETIAATPRRSGREPAPVEDQREGTTAKARSNAMEAFIVFAGTLYFVLLLAIALELSRTRVSLGVFLFGVCVVGLVICALSWAGLWPFPSPWFPEPNFSSRNLRHRQGSSTSAPGPRPRFSGTAIVGAFWPLLLPLGLLLNQLAAVAMIRSEPRGIWMTLSGISGMLLIALGEVSVVGTTILGWIAVSQIRRSSGRLYGLGLAVFDGLLFPLLALNALLIGLPLFVYYLCYLFYSPAQPPVLPDRPWLLPIPLIITVSLVVSVVLDFGIIRRVWRAVNQPLDGGQTLPNASAAGKQGRPPFFGTGWVLTAAVLPLAILMGAVFLANYLPRRSRPETAGSQNLSFGPPVELVVTNMIDFDSGALADLPLARQPGERDVERYDWINGPNIGVSWMRKHGMDAIDANHGLIGVDMFLVPLESGQWDSLSCAGLQERLQALNLPAAPATDILNDSPGIYGFKTREGALGIVQITDSRVPRGVKIRYKLALPATSTNPPAPQETLIYQTAPVTRGALSQIVAATGTLNHPATNTRQWRIEASVNGADVAGVEAGQDVRFTLEAFPQRTFTGKLLEVGNTPVRQDDVVDYIAQIAVPDPDPKFKPGMTASVAFIIAHRENVLRIPNAALRFRPPRGSTLPPATLPPDVAAKHPNVCVVYVMRAGKIELPKGVPFMIGRPEATLIRIGISDGVLTEVKVGGLQVGDRVVTGMRKVEGSPSPGLEKLKKGGMAISLSESPRTGTQDFSTATAQPGEFKVTLTNAVSKASSVAGSRSIVAKWKDRVAAMNASDWRGALRVATEVAGLPPEDGLAVIRACWTSVTNAESRKQFLKAFRFAEHPRLTAVLELGLLDPAPPVQDWALTYLRDVALRDFSTDYGAAKKWLTERAEWPLSRVEQDAARECVSRLRTAEESQLQTQLKELANNRSLLRKRPSAAVQAGLNVRLGELVNHPNPDTSLLALRAARYLSFDDAWRKQFALPRLDSTNTWETRRAAAAILGVPGCEWAVGPLLGTLSDAVAASERTAIWGVAQALAKIGSPRAIPHMIALIESDNSYDTVYGIGYFGLNPLTSVKYDAGHDGAWWRQWWQKNKERYPAEVKAVEIPHLR